MSDYSKLYEQKNTPYIIFSIFKYVKKKRSNQILLLLAFLILNGVLEFLTISAIIPYLFAISKPEYLKNNFIINEIIKNLYISNDKELVVLLTLVFIGLAMSCGIFKTFNIWYSNKLSAAIGSDLSMRIYSNNLYQSYESHITKNSSETMNVIVSCINRSVLGIYCSLQIISNTFLVIFISTALLIINWETTLIGFLIFAISYLIIGKLTKKRITSNSVRMVRYGETQIKAMQEGLGSVRDLILSGNYDIFLKVYSNADIPIRRLNAENKFLSLVPRFFLESLSISLIAFLGYFFVVINNNGDLFIPVLGSIALGAQRLLPSMQQIYSNWSQMSSYKADLIVVLNSVGQKVYKEKEITGKIILKKNIKFDHVYFKYANNKEVISNMNLKINYGESIGLIGETGSGKSTTVDLIMGLLKPSKGKILVDETDIYDDSNGYLNSWRRSIAHVPQTIFLTDNSILENIAFGFPFEEIDLNLVKQVSKLALINKFILSTKNTYYTKVGEYGVSLSGGQRQRIGIARAFYKIYKTNTNLIVFDEATNALDETTERKIIKNLMYLKNITKIIISHNLNNLSACNRIIDVRKETI